MAQKPITIFDLDGTLIDISERHYLVYSEIIKDIGGTPISKKEYWDHKRANASWDTILKASDLSSENIELFLQKFISEIEKPKNLEIDTLIKNAKDILANVSSSTDCYLISLRRNADNLLNQLKFLGIDQYFAGIKSGHTDGKGHALKSDIINELPKTEHRILVIGDTESDILAAQKVDAQSVAVLSGIRNRELIENMNPGYIIEDISELLDLEIVQEHFNQ